MLYMIIFWVIFIISLSLIIVNRKIKNKGLDYIIGYLIIVQLIIIAVAIATNDPFFQDIGIPKEYEWLVGLLSGGFLLWQFYLSPLKERVIKTETKTESIITKVDEIKGDVFWIKSNCNISFKK